MANPDKNPEEKAIEVTQFILNEAVRIWSDVQDQASSGGGSWSDPSGFSNDFYEEMFRQWGEQARSHRFTRERYHSNFSSRSSFNREEYRESQRYEMQSSCTCLKLDDTFLKLKGGECLPLLRATTAHFEIPNSILISSLNCWTVCTKESISLL